MPQRSRRPGQVDPTELLQSPLYSRTCKHAFRVMERLAAAAIQRPGSVRKLDALAAETGTTIPTLEQVAYLLRLAGLLDAPPDRPGGIRLSRPASQISVLAVVLAVDGAGLWKICILGLAKCSDDAPCPAHSVWKKTREVLWQHLESQSLADLTRVMAKRRQARRATEVRRGRIGSRSGLLERSV